MNESVLELAKRIVEWDCWDEKHVPVLADTRRLARAFVEIGETMNAWGADDAIRCSVIERILNATEEGK